MMRKKSILVGTIILSVIIFGSLIWFSIPKYVYITNYDVYNKNLSIPFYSTYSIKNTTKTFNFYNINRTVYNIDVYGKLVLDDTSILCNGVSAFGNAKIVITSSILAVRNMMFVYNCCMIPNEIIFMYNESTLLTNDVIHYLPSSTLSDSLKNCRVAYFWFGLHVIFYDNAKLEKI